MSVKWTENPNFEEHLREKLAKRLNAVGEFLSETLFDNLSRNFFDNRVASLPGEYPKMRQQVLRNSVLPHAFDDENMEIIVGPSIDDAPYVADLVLMDRKFAYNTLEENIDEVIRIFATGK